MSVHPDRLHILKGGAESSGPVIYWMSRDQRVEDNWALLHAQEQAIERNVSLLVAFCLVPGFGHAGRRQYEFLLEGLRQVEGQCAQLSIPFVLLHGDPAQEVPAFVSALGASLLVADFDPLRIKQGWQAAVAERVSIPFAEVDAHNIVPCRVVSDKQEYAARTIRPKIHRLLHEFLEPFPLLQPHPYPFTQGHLEPDWSRVQVTANAVGSVPPVDWLLPGPVAATDTLKQFMGKGLPQYAQARNDPTADGCSGLSPYLHFGHISAQRVALEVVATKGAGQENKDAFLEELIVRRELSDNFCLHNPDHDRYQGIPDWGRKTLEKHAKDPRSFLYSLDEFESARTHSPLWNAAQSELLQCGKMHGYMRMFWAKKILEWSESPSQAVEVALYLNDRYSLDGRDPNGCVGVLWSIGGLHDRPWGERPVFGTVRCMTESGCRRKFNTEKYIAQWT
jgi:deoxyribodipyrimidine photo-lyase